MNTGMLFWLSVEMICKCNWCAGLVLYCASVLLGLQQ